MSKMRALLFSFVLILVFGGLLMTVPKLIQKSFSSNVLVKKYRLLLLGASVGYEWKIPEWPKRVGRDDIVFEMVAAYAFDKSDALNEILMRPKRKFRISKRYLTGFLKPAPQKPEIIIIKECAAYFPGDLGKYKELVKKWVNQCKAGAIKPVLATVVPVTGAHSQERLGRLQGILEYNDWIREYAKENGIGYLDLEAALRISQIERILRPDLTIGDGLHLNKKAYDILDKILLENSTKLFN